VRLGVGVLALVLLLTAESTLALWVQGRTLAQAVAGRDPVSGSVYLAMLVVFATMPLWVGRLPRA
jgi:type IV secretory pathway TrbD component